MATKLFGLVLAGGKSTRMGKDKGKLSYHNLPQREFTYNLLENLCERVFLSIRKDQHEEVANFFNVIIDQNEFRGPFNGLQSAYEKFPEVAWLVLATDLPLIDSKNLKKLIAERDPEKVATAFATSKSKLPEPLCAIWEAHGLKKAKTYLQTAESSCPRKFLINSNTRLVYPDNDQVLMNANSLEELNAARQIIASR